MSDVRGVGSLFPVVLSISARAYYNASRLGLGLGLKFNPKLNYMLVR